MAADTRFHVERIDPQNTTEVQEALNGLVERDDVAELVDWRTVESGRSLSFNLIMEYVPEDS